MVHWWKATDRVKPKYPEKNLGLLGDRLEAGDQPLKP
jgi:hypothetical protein